MNSKKSPILYYLGNCLILLSLFSTIYIYYPILFVYLYPQDTQQVVAVKEPYITIPKIHAQAKILPDIDPWNEIEYRKALKKGVAHAKGTALPGGSGTSFLFAHSSDLPWNITRDNTSFFRLSELTLGDQIIITRDGKKITYKVTDIKEVASTEIQYLKKNDTTQLILQTCTPIGTDWRRLLIFAKLV